MFRQGTKLNTLEKGLMKVEEIPLGYHIESLVGFSKVVSKHSFTFNKLKYKLEGNNRVIYLSATKILYNNKYHCLGLNKRFGNFEVTKLVDDHFLYFKIINIQGLTKIDEGVYVV